MAVKNSDDFYRGENQNSVKDNNISDGKLYKTLFELSPVGLMIENEFGDILDVNEAICKSTGYSREEMINTNVVKLVPEGEEELVKANIKRLLSGKTLIHDVRNIRKDGSLSYMELREKMIILPGNKKGILVIANDVTEKKFTELSAKQYLKELEAANITKDKFFSIIAHDLKNPFNTILGFSKLLFNEYHNFSDDEKRTIIEGIKSSSENTFRLLENLLEWSRIQTNQIKINYIKFNLTQVIGEILNLFKIQAEQKKVRIITSLTNPSVIVADANIIRTILRNIISNAIKFSYEGGNVEISTESEGGLTRISVKDFGTGLSEAEKSKLFKIDSKFKKSGTKNEPGTGLGLILCKELIDKCKGKITVESETGKGSVFSIYIPEKKITEIF